MAKKPLNTREITKLLSKLKSTTPDYPNDLMAARKATFLKQAAMIKLDGGGQGGQGGSGGSSAAPGGTSAAHGFFWPAVIGISVVTALLLAAYTAYREQITDLLIGDEVAALEVGAETSSVETLTAIATEPTPSVIATPTFFTPTLEITITVPVTDSSGNTLNGTPGVIGTPSGTKDNSGLHLGQTPGTPAAPGQGNPGNPNKPDKPEKPDKPKKN